ncbi:MULTISPECIES: 4Fe-4S binding protein [Desulfosediminicola]|uniref:4Fe-4S binding protein n=1 Tax=Desulfosediminicola TaxID=2886823 RepID=UPI0010AD1944|nr:4Fe-4S binding protein [Desulfosediminicola ganghwensis]
MGHHINGKDSIVPLIDRLNRYPIGLPDNEKLRQILAILFSEDEAYVGSRFPLQESTMKELIRATGWQEEKLTPVLDSMADKGLIMDFKYGRRVYYLLLPGLIGFFELTFMKRRQDLPVEELAQLMHDYLFEDPDDSMGNEFFNSPTPLTRSLTYEEHIPVHSEVTTYESARDIIKKAGYGAVGMCYCRHKKEHLNKSCDKNAPVEEICISLGHGAKFMVRRGFAEERSVDELLAVLDRARELNLTHITDNIRNKPSFICNCCSCCCELLGGVLRGFPNGVAKANFTLEIEAESCKGCGLCAKACNVEALVRVENPAGGKPKFKMTVDPERCLGCGACVSACKTDSLSMVRVERPETPEKKKDLFKQILKEKKRLTPFVIEGVKTTVMRKIGLS